MTGMLLNILLEESLTVITTQSSKSGRSDATIYLPDLAGRTLWDQRLNRPDPGDILDDQFQGLLAARRDLSKQVQHSV